MNDLERYFYANTKRVIHKFPHYFDIYERHFSRFRGQDVCLVEIGIGDGGSLQMWKDYFGPKAQIIGMDISVENAIADDPQIRVIHGNQGRAEDLNKLVVSLGRPIDILIDDGSHQCQDQILSFAYLFQVIASNGVYMCEDVQTSYWSNFGGGYKSVGSFIEFMKSHIDQLNGWVAEPNEDFLKTHFMRTTHSIHFYPFAVVLEKMPMDDVMRSPVVSGGPHVRQG